jgi:hypothetical protein
MTIDVQSLRGAVRELKEGMAAFDRIWPSCCEDFGARNQCNYDSQVSRLPRMVRRALQDANMIISQL